MTRMTRMEKEKGSVKDGRTSYFLSVFSAQFAVERNNHAFSFRHSFIGGMCFRVSARPTSLRHFSPRPLLLRDRPDDEFTSGLRSKRCLRLSNCRRNERLNFWTSQHIYGLNANEASLGARAKEDLLWVR